MPTVSVANFENDELLSSRLLSFMAGTEQLNMGGEMNVTNGTKFANSGSFGSSIGSLTDGDMNGSSNLRSPFHRNGANATMAAMHDRLFNGSPSDITTSNSTGFVSGSCTPPLPSVHPLSTVPTGYLPLRNHSGAPPYSALTSPCLTNKMNPGAGVQQLLGYNNCNMPTEYHSLQNSPFYSHYPVNGNVPAQLHRQLGGLSPGPIGPLVSNGVSPLTGNPRNGLYQDLAYPLSGTMRALTTGNGSCPQRELFPNPGQTGAQCGSSIFGSGLLMQDRLHYYSLAQKHGFIVGAELERVKENSCRSTSQSYGRIAAHFRHRYGETEAKTKSTYLQIGVRVPSKDHVSEIVGKGGQKIKLIREETGALITTPGEHEEHVFIIEAPPEIALRVAHHLTARAQEITQSKLAAGERRRGSASSQSTNGLDANGAFPSLTNGSNNLAACSTSSILSLTTSGITPGTVIPLGTSASNSPLHPSAAGGLLSTSNANGTGLRTSAVGLFTPQLSSLPSSPCSTSANGGLGHGSAQPLNGGSLFLGSNGSSGSRVLLARSRISVPQDMVGKIIGTQGSIITTIQKDTGTEIKSPPKEAARGPNATSEFEISAYQGVGLSSNQAAECRVQQAKQLIGHLVMRQLERRASEEVDETSGSPNLSSDEQRHGNGGASSSKAGMTSWMWPDVAQMDSQEAREVLDRILAESKNKTRRAKELAAAAAVSTGPSPTGGCQSGSMLNISNPLVAHTVGMMGAEQQLLSNSGLFDPVDPTAGEFDPADLTAARDLTHSLSSELSSVGLFSPHANRFMKRNSSAALVDDNGFSRIGPQPCSPRTLTGLGMSDPSELIASYHRGPVPSSNRNTDIWNSASNFSASTTMSSQLVGNVRPTLNNSCDSTNSNPLHNYLNSGSVLSNSFHSPPPAAAAAVQPCGVSDPTMLRNRSHVTNGFGGLKDEQQANIFTFSDSANGLNSGFGSGSDLSPTMLMPASCRSPLHQPLTRRHSDWVVSASSTTGGLATDMAISRAGRPTTTATGRGMFAALEPPCEANQSAFSNSNGFDLLKALDQLCLNSSADDLSAGDLGPQTTSASSQMVATSLGLLSQCPPGFEQLPPPLSAETTTSTTIATTTNYASTKLDEASDLREHLCGRSSLASGPWSNPNDSPGGVVPLFFSSDHASADSSRSKSNSKFSVLQRLFHDSSPDELITQASVTTAHLNSIWSSASSMVDCSNRTVPPADASNPPPYTFTPYSDAINAASLLDPALVVDESLTHAAAASAASDPVNLFHTLSSSSSELIHTGSGSPGELSSRCGTIGEGRRRRGARGQSPSPLTNELDSVVPISVSAVVASITEVA